MSPIAELNKALVPLAYNQQDQDAMYLSQANMACVGREFLALPFDMAREQYAKSVRAGWVERSIIASARVEHAISAMEQFTLGCLARRY
jgi:hypothetical protein